MAQTHTDPRPIPPPTNGRLQPPGSLPGSSINTLRSSHLSPLTISSPVTQHGCFEFDRIIKAGEVLKRTRKTKAWKPIHIVLRPNLLSIYRDKEETKLKHQVNLSDLTAVARQKDPKRKDKYVFGLFSPGRNFHLEASTEKEAQEWVELIRREARIDEDEDHMVLMSPGESTKRKPWSGFGLGRSMHEQASYSSSEAEMPAPLGSILKARDHERGQKFVPRRTSHTLDYSGAEGAGSYSDFSDVGAGVGHAARMSALSLNASEGRPSTGGPPSALSPGAGAGLGTSVGTSVSTAPSHSVYGTSPRPGVFHRSTSQMSIGALASSQPRAANAEQDAERVVYHSWIYMLKSHRGVRQWKKLWMVLRPRQLALYKDESEYSALLIVPFSNIIDAVEIDPISKSKQHCMQVLTEERNYRFCCTSDESLTRWLGAFKSLLSKRKARDKEKEKENVAAAAAAAATSATAR